MEPAGPQCAAWFQFAAVTAFLVVLIVLLDKFHRFLVDALAAQYEAKVALETGGGGPGRGPEASGTGAA